MGWFSPAPRLSRPRLAGAPPRAHKLVHVLRKCYGRESLRVPALCGAPGMPSCFALIGKTTPASRRNVGNMTFFDRMRLTLCIGKKLFDARIGQPGIDEAHQPLLEVLRGEALGILAAHMRIE
jgi:hypothetical protein